MLDTKFVFIHDEDRSKEYGLVRTCVNAGAATIKKPWDAKYRVGVADENLGMPRDFAGAKTRAKELLRKRPSGVTIVMERLTSDGEVADKVRFRKITVKPPVPNTEGVEGIDRIVGWVNQEAREGRLKGVRYAGICVCKPNSDHADCAAVDIFATWESMEKIQREMWRDPHYYHTKYTILGRVITFFGHSDPYTGDFHAHIHISVNGGINNSAC